MVTCTGKSLIPISIEAFQSFMNSVVPQAKLPEFTIKLDARPRVKSVFAKLEGTELTLYTGPIVNQGAQKFSEISDAFSLLMLFTIYGVKKAGAGEDFEVKTNDQGVSNTKCDTVFQELSGKVHFFVEKFVPINQQAIMASVEPVLAPDATPSISTTPGQPVGQYIPDSQPVQDTVEKPKKASSKVSPFKDVPLENTPKIDVPDDLDLRQVV